VLAELGCCYSRTANEQHLSTAAADVKTNRRSILVSGAKKDFELFQTNPYFIMSTDAECERK
jgi:hypothetical protein